MIPNFRLNTIVFVTATLLLTVMLVHSSAIAQPPENKEIKKLDRQIGNLIRSLKEIKWQDITIYRLGADYYSRLKSANESSDQKDKDALDEIGKTIYDEPLADLANNAITCATPDAARKDFKRWTNCIVSKYPGLDPQEFIDKEADWKDVWQKASAIVLRRKNFPKAFYLITSRSREGSTPRLIALAGMEQDDGTGNSAIKQVWAGTELYSYLRSNGRDTTMYSEMKAAAMDIRSPDLINQMFSMRDMSELVIATQTKAHVRQVPDDRQEYILPAISEKNPIRKSDTAVVDSNSIGLPPMPGDGIKKNPMASAEVPNTKVYPYVLSFGTDVVASFREYDVKDKTNPSLMWGVELKSGLDELNYPSVWGGRMTLNAILENIKVGVVLPTLRFGDTSIATSGFSSMPQKIIGGIGVAFSGDFAAPVMNNSGLFNFHGSYTASTSGTSNMIPLIYNKINGVIDSANPLQAGESAYLIRFNFQGYYSFGFTLDDARKHLFRIKIGGTVYGVDEYKLVRVQSVENNKKTLSDPETTKAIDTDGQPAKTDAFGGFSVKLEYMKSGQRIPYGASIQYFDQSLMGDLWVQFIANDAMDILVGGKLAMPVLRDLHPWENNSIFAPTVTLRYHFE